MRTDKTNGYRLYTCYFLRRMGLIADLPIRILVYFTLHATYGVEKIDAEELRFIDVLPDYASYLGKLVSTFVPIVLFDVYLN